MEIIVFSFKPHFKLGDGFWSYTARTMTMARKLRKLKLKRRVSPYHVSMVTYFHPRFILGCAAAESDRLSFAVPGFGNNCEVEAWLLTGIRSQVLSWLTLGALNTFFRSMMACHVIANRKRARSEEGAKE